MILSSPAFHFAAAVANIGTPAAATPIEPPQATIDTPGDATEAQPAVGQTDQIAQASDLAPAEVAPLQVAQAEPAPPPAEDGAPAPEIDPGTAAAAAAAQAAAATSAEQQASAAAAAAAPPAAQGPPTVSADEALLDGRRRPGVQEGLPDRITQDNVGAVSPPPPEAFPTDQIPVPDRWRLVQALCPDKNFPGVQDTCRSILDPYHQNFLKGDRPINPKDVGTSPGLPTEA